MSAAEATPLIDATFELKHALDDAAAGGDAEFESALPRAVALLEPGTPLGDELARVLPRVEFDAWFEAACATMRGSVGSATLRWPLDNATRVAHQLELLRRVARGKPDLHGLCFTFMYPERGGDEARVRIFAERVSRPFLRDLVTLVKPALDREDAAAAPAPPAPASTIIYNLHGNNSRVTFGTDASHNVVQVTPDRLFEELRRATEARVEDAEARGAILTQVTALEVAHGTPTFGERYLQFMGAIADHAAVFGPFLPALAQLLIPGP